MVGQSGLEANALSLVTIPPLQTSNNVATAVNPIEPSPVAAVCDHRTIRNSIYPRVAKITLMRTKFGGRKAAAQRAMLPGPDSAKLPDCFAAAFDFPFGAAGGGTVP